LLKAIPDPELSVTEADIDLQLRKTLISTSAEIDPDLDAAFQKIRTMGSNIKGKVEADQISLQADYVSLLGLGNEDFMDWNYLDADEDADISLF
jgi:hypothetical protein